MGFIFEDRPAESPLIETIWQTRSEEAGSFISTAATRFGLVVSRHQGKTTLTIRGPETVASQADYPADVEFFGIVFKLGTFMPPLPPRMVMDRQDVNLPEAGSRSFWLQGSAWEFPTFENADTFVERLVRQGLLAHEPVVDAALEGQPQYLSPRAVQYRFLYATGLTQATVRQIDRARQAAILLQQGVSILDTVYETGYSDQSHLTRSLRRFMGQTPLQVAQLDRLNPG